MQTITSEPILMKLTGDATNAYVFAIQATTNGEAPTAGQIDAARNAAKSVLELLGAEVTATSSVVDLQALEGKPGVMTIECALRLEEEEVEIDEDGEDALEQSV